ncbi:hypothetical protein EY02_14545, partial [Staphylococcus aureus]
HKNSVERERFYQLPQSEYFLPSQTNFIFVKTKRVNELYEALLNIVDLQVLQLLRIQIYVSH